MLRAIDKLDRLGIEGVRQLLGEGRKDESGDFTPGANLSEQQVQDIIQYVLATVDSRAMIDRGEGNTDATPIRPTTGLDVLDEVDRHFPNVTVKEATGTLRAIDALVSTAGYGPDRIRIDPSVVRGLEYYTGPVYEAELLFDVTNEKGETVRFGSVGGGGRYDGMLDERGLRAPVLVTVMDGGTEALGRYQKFTQDLREAGIRAEMYQGNWKKFGNQLRYADRRGCPIAIIQGSDERAAGKIQIKDMIEGRRQAAAFSSNEEYRAARLGQFEIDRDDLVDAVKKLLAAQKAG